MDGVANLNQSSPFDDVDNNNNNNNNNNPLQVTTTDIQPSLILKRQHQQSLTQSIMTKSRQLDACHFLDPPFCFSSLLYF
jgi:hypothetical protein